MIHCFPQHTTAILVIPPPFHHLRMQDFGFVDLWYNIALLHIFGTILTTTAHNLVLKQRE